MKRIRILAGAQLLLLLASPVLAHLPDASKIRRAVAAANRSGGRTQVLRLEVALRLGGGPVVGKGELLMDPAGQVRLELTGPSGLLERHLRTRGSYRATRNGVPLDDPRPFAPPLYLLQSSSRSAVRAAFPSWSPDRVDLGRLGDRDCWVLGGRGGSADGALAEALHPAFWVDIESHDLRRIDLAPGVWIRLGLAKAFGELVLPSWIEIHPVRSEPMRLEVLGAEPIQPGPGAFDAAWLRGP